MAHINVRLAEIGEGYVQYQSVAAYLEMGPREFLLDSVLLDSEDYEEDLDLIEGFCGGFEMMAEENKMEIIFHPEIQNLVSELEFLYAQEQEEIRLEEEKTLERCQD